MFRYLLQIAFRNLLQAKRRTLLLGTALAMVTMLLVVLMSISQGIYAVQTRAATTISAGHVVVGGFYKITSGKGVPRIVEASEVMDIVRENTPDLAYITDRQRGFGKVIGITGSMTAGYTGIDIDQESGFRDVVRLIPESEYREGGRDEVLGDLSKLKEYGSILLFKTQAERLGVTVGDQVTLSSETGRGAYNTLDATVVAVADDMGMLTNWTVFLSKESIDEIYRTGDNTTGAIYVYLNDINNAETAMHHLRDVLASNGYAIMDHLSAPFFQKFDIVNGEAWTGQKLDLTTWKDEVQFIVWMVDAFDYLTGALITILIFIIGVGIANTMYIAVRERTSEVGSLRAMGMSRGKVLLMFLFEALLLGLLGTSIGAAIGLAVVLGMDAAGVTIAADGAKLILLTDKLPLSPVYQESLRYILMLSVFAGIFAIFPAMKAARLQPVVAMSRK